MSKNQPVATTAKKERKPRATVPPNETKEQKFVRLANKRVNNALRLIKILGQLGGPNYESSDEQKSKIEAVLNEAVEKAINQLKSVKNQVTTFKL